jgi:hypothetical protein
MTATNHKRTQEWRCDDCLRETDTLYFEGTQQVCESCRRMRRRPELKPASFCSHPERPAPVP